MNNYKEWLKTIEFTPDLNGGGPVVAPVFKNLLSGKQFDTAFEWCAGPAWIGMWLLENNICKTLVTGDINEKSVRYVQMTAKNNNYNVRSYVSDNLKQIPKHEKFDLVVASPPNYCNIQESHPLGYLRHDLRPSDVDWEIHKDFYRNIGEYLNKDAEMYISEVDPYNKYFYLDGKLYDKRPEVPMQEFKKMIKVNDLELKQVIPYNITYENLECYILKIKQKYGV